MTDVGPGGIVDEEYATPDGDDIYQAEHEPGQVTVPVSVEGIVQTDEMPTELGACRNILLPAGSRAIKIIQANPKRKRLIICQVISIDTEITKVCISSRQGDADSFAGGLIESGAQAICRNEFFFKDEVWARPCIITDTSGLLTAIAPSAMDTYISIFEEMWAR